MMLTALNTNDQTIIDVTTLDLEHIHMLNGKRVAQRHGYDLICKGCHHPAHLVRNHHKTVFFRHNPGSGNCILNELGRGNSESAEHLNGKATIIAALRDLTGWDAKPEQVHSDDRDTVIVDVEATYLDTPHHDAQGNFAWEVQLAHQTGGEFHERTTTIQRITGYQPRWLTPYASAVADAVAMICDPNAEFVTDRLLTSYEPEIASPPLPVGQVVKSVHRKNAGHRWFQRGDEFDNAWHIAHIDAFRTGPPPLRNNTPRPETSDTYDTPCARAPVAEGWQPIVIDMPHINTGEHICASCGTTVTAPWGFTFDPPMCKGCFQNRQTRYLKGA